MNIWLALWIVLSVTMLGFLVWSLMIAFRQKRAWKAFAEKYKLRYVPGRMMQSPEMDGTIEDYKFNFFTGEHVTPDIRATRKMTGVEITLASSIPTEGCVASGGMIPLLKSLNYKVEITPQHESWSKAYSAQGVNRNALEAYLTDERVQVLTKLMQITNVWLIFVFRDGRALLRLDTPNPLDTPEQLDKLVKILIKAAKVLELKAGEAQTIKLEEAKPVRESTITVTEEKIQASASAFELEEDDPA